MFKIFFIITFVAWYFTMFNFCGFTFEKEKSKKIFLTLFFIGVIAMLAGLWLQISYIYELIVPVAT